MYTVIIIVDEVKYSFKGDRPYELALVFCIENGITAPEVFVDESSDYKIDSVVKKLTTAEFRMKLRKATKDRSDYMM